MNDLISYIILGGVFLFTLVLGVWAGKDVKTMKDYVLANRELSTAVVTMSMLATCIGAAEIRYPNYIFRYGIVDMLQALPYTITFLMIGAFIAPNMVYFHDCLTTGDIMQKLYGNTARTFTGAVNFVFSILIISSQIRAVGYLNSHLLGLPAEQVILSVGMVIVVYTLLGGMRSVVYTDVLQFISISVVILFLTIVLVYQIGGLKALFTNLPDKKLTLISNPTLGYAVKGALFWGGPTLLLTPPVLMRMLMIQDKRQASNMFFSGAMVNALMRIAFMLIGLSTVVYFSGFS
ncbi:MAG: hypothetical protein AAF380_02070 [Bacteroidota bacterium]